MSQLCRRHRHYSPLAVKMLASWGGAVLRALSAICTLPSTVHIRSNEPPKPPLPINNSTSALNYKTSHKVRPPPLPKRDLPRSQSAEEVVMNILYNTPLLSPQPTKSKPPPFFLFFPLAAAAATATTTAAMWCDYATTAMTMTTTVTATI
jgi:hypothetical protein